MSSAPERVATPEHGVVPEHGAPPGHGVAPHPSPIAPPARADIPNWWQHEFQTFLSLDSTRLAPNSLEFITDWIEDPRIPTPAALGEEIQRASHGEWSAEDLRDYLHHQRGHEVPLERKIAISTWLGW